MSKLVFESCQIEEVCIALGSNEKILYQLRDELEDWLSLQPHLPQDVPKRKLEWILLSTKMSLQRAKQRLHMYYSMNQLIPELFTNRDPRGPGITSAHEVMQFVMLPKLDPNNYRTVIIRITEADSSKLLCWEIAKYIFMVGDIRMVEGPCFGENVVIDLSMMNLGHFMKCTPTLFEKCDVAGKKAYGLKIQGFHFINAPPYVDYLVTVVKSVLSHKLSSRVHVHPAGNLEKFYQFIPKSILPKDYGGDEPTMAELDAALREKVEERRDWFIKHEQIQVNEQLSPAPLVKEDSILGCSGSFRKIEVD